MLAGVASGESVGLDRLGAERGPVAGTNIDQCDFEMHADALVFVRDGEIDDGNPGDEAGGEIIALHFQMSPKDEESFCFAVGGGETEGLGNVVVGIGPDLVRDA